MTVEIRCIRLRNFFKLPFAIYSARDNAILSIFYHFKVNSYYFLSTRILFCLHKLKLIQIIIYHFKIKIKNKAAYLFIYLFKNETSKYCKKLFFHSVKPRISLSAPKENQRLKGGWSERKKRPVSAININFIKI